MQSWFFCRYIVKDVLGHGTFGQVAKCWVPEMGNFVAVKIIKNQPAYYQQALVEVSILTTVIHIFLFGISGVDSVNLLSTSKIDCFLHKCLCCCLFFALCSWTRSTILRTSITLFVYTITLYIVTTYAYVLNYLTQICKFADMWFCIKCTFTTILWL